MIHLAAFLHHSSEFIVTEWRAAHELADDWQVSLQIFQKILPEAFAKNNKDSDFLLHVPNSKLNSREQQLFNVVV